MAKLNYGKRFGTTIIKPSPDEVGKVTKSQPAKEKEMDRSAVLDALAAIRKRHAELLSEGLPPTALAVQLLRFARYERGLSGAATQGSGIHAALKVIDGLVKLPAVSARKKIGGVSPALTELYRSAHLENTTEVDSTDAEIRRIILAEHPLTIKRQSELAQKFATSPLAIARHIKSMKYEGLIE